MTIARWQITVDVPGDLPAIDGQRLVAEELESYARMLVLGPLRMPQVRHFGASPEGLRGVSYSSIGYSLEGLTGGFTEGIF